MKSRIPFVLWLLTVALLVALSWQTYETPTAPGAAERQEITITSPRSARVAVLHVRAGQAVAVDQVVAQLESPRLDDDIRIAKAELARLKAIVEATAQGAQADRDAKTQRLAAQADRAALDAAKAKAAQQRDRARLAGLKTRRRQQAKLVKQGLVTRRQLDEIDAELVTLRQRIAASNTAVAQAKANAAAGRDRAAPGPQVSTAPQQHAVRAQEERLKALERAKAALQLRAPVAGNVSRLFLRVGDTAVADAPLLAIVQARVDTVVAYADEAWSQRVAVGDQAFMTDRPGALRRGIVTGIAPDIRELPRRFWLVHTEPRYGRPVFVRLNTDAVAIAPGQALDVWFRKEGAP